MEYQIGDSVRYIPGYRGWHAATVVGFDGVYVVIELSNGKVLSVYEDELEGA